MINDDSTIIETLAARIDSQVMKELRCNQSYYWQNTPTILSNSIAQLFDWSKIILLIAFISLNCYALGMNSQTLKPTDIKAARELSRLFAQHKGHSTQLQIGSEQITLPKNVLQIMLEVTTQLANGNQVSVLSKDSDLTTAETADLLNVSRPYVVQLLNEGKLPFRMVGTHRRVLLEDAMQYKEAQRKKSLEIMAELSKESQELGDGY